MLAISVIFGILIGIYLPRRSDLQQNPGIRLKNDKLTTILNIIESNYVDTVNRAELIEAAIPSILKKLDPHSICLPTLSW